MSPILHAKRVVIKIGTSTLTYPTGSVNYRLMEQLVGVLADLKNSGKEIILVSSGAVGIGMGMLGLTERPVDTPTRQACAAVGQCQLMYTYERFFSMYHHKVAQILLTQDVIRVQKRRENTENTFSHLLNFGVIPVINENDAISIDEIAYDGNNNAFGDNDTLSAIVVKLCGADLLIMLSDIDGLYDKNPQMYSDATLLHTVHEVTDSLFRIAAGAGSKLGTGGMTTKLNAAKLCLSDGVPMAIINGSNPNYLYDLFDQKQVGTLFYPPKKLQTS